MEVEYWGNTSNWHEPIYLIEGSFWCLFTLRTLAFILNFGLDPIKVNKGTKVALLERVKEICKFEPEPQPFDKIIGSVSKIEDGCLPELRGATVAEW